MYYVVKGEGSNKKYYDFPDGWHRDKSLGQKMDLFYARGVAMSLGARVEEAGDG